MGWANAAAQRGIRGAGTHFPAWPALHAAPASGMSMVRSLQVVAFNESVVSTMPRAHKVLLSLSQGADWEELPWLLPFPRPEPLLLEGPDPAGLAQAEELARVLRQAVEASSGCHELPISFDRTHCTLCCRMHTRRRCHPAPGDCTCTR